jgi:hypothetical protein
LHEFRVESHRGYLNSIGAYLFEGEEKKTTTQSNQTLKTKTQMKKQKVKKNEFQITLFVLFPANSWVSLFEQFLYGITMKVHIFDKTLSIFIFFFLFEFFLNLF